MSRALRLEFPGAIWHVTSRGNERRDIVRSDRDRLFFLDLLAEVVELHRWVLHAWVLMSNHHHILIETPIPTLSRGVKRLNEVYADGFNFRHHRVGHLFQGRFKGILVERESHLLELVRYIVLNPVRAGMVRSPAEYRWSSYRATAGIVPAPPWLEVGWTLGQFGSSTTESRRRYRAFVGNAAAQSYRPWDQLVGQIFLGGEAFCERMQARIDAVPRSRAHPKAQRRIVLPSFEAVIDAVADEFGESPDTIRQRSHRPSRKALAQLGWQESGLTLGAIGEWIGLSEQAVSHLVKRGKQLEATDDDYASRLRRIRLRLGSDRTPF